MAGSCLTSLAEKKILAVKLSLYGWGNSHILMIGTAYQANHEIGKFPPASQLEGIFFEVACSTWTKDDCMPKWTGLFLEWEGCYTLAMQCNGLFLIDVGLRDSNCIISAQIRTPKDGISPDTSARRLSIRFKVGDSANTSTAMRHLVQAHLTSTGK